MTSARLFLGLLSAIAGVAPATRAAEGDVAPGSVLIASCEGLSVWDRDGNRGFARYFVPDMPPDGAKASVVAWADMLYDGCRLPSGNYLCAAHEWVREIARGGLVEVSPAGETVWQLTAEEVPGFGGWFGGFHRFENGNTLIANSDWHYHTPKETAVQLVEVTRDKRLVWQLGLEKFAGTKPGSLEPRTGLVEQRIIGIEWLGTR